MTQKENQFLLSMIVAVDNNYLMGSDLGGLPWSGIERDKIHFRKYVKGKTILTGRKTFEEMKGWFQPHHTPYVLTQKSDYQATDDAFVFNKIEDAISIAKQKGVDEMVVCGGAEIYRLALKYSSKIIMTILDSYFEAQGKPKYFPSIEELTSLGFEEYKREKFMPSDQNQISMSIIWLNRDCNKI